MIWIDLGVTLFSETFLYNVPASLSWFSATLHYLHWNQALLETSGQNAMFPGSGAQIWSDPIICGGRGESLESASSPALWVSLRIHLWYYSKFMLCCVVFSFCIFLYCVVCVVENSTCMHMHMLYGIFLIIFLWILFKLFGLHFLFNVITKFQTYHNLFCF